MGLRPWPGRTETRARWWQGWDWLCGQTEDEAGSGSAAGAEAEPGSAD